MYKYVAKAFVFFPGNQRWLFENRACFLVFCDDVKVFNDDVFYFQISRVVGRLSANGIRSSVCFSLWLSNAVAL